MSFLPLFGRKMLWVDADHGYVWFRWAVIGLWADLPRPEVDEHPQAGPRPGAW